MVNCTALDVKPIFWDFIFLGGMLALSADEERQTLDQSKVDDLINGFLGGDRGKTESLIKYYYRNVYFNCLRMVRDEAAAEDLTHESFIRALKYKSSFDRTQKFIFWLLKISTNVCLQYFNENKKDRFLLVHIDALDDSASSINNLNKILIDKKSHVKMEEKFENEIILKAVMLLPLIYRVPVLLRFYNDLSYEEIATILKKPVGTIKFRINRAKGLLAGALQSFVNF